MFSMEERCIFQKNQLLEVICQLRFPEILAISAKPPVDFQEAVREEYSQYRQGREIPQPKVTGTPGAFRLTEQPETINHMFSTQDGMWRINLTSKFISLTCTKYQRWEEFARRLDRLLAAFISAYHPAGFERVGLRFVNAFSREDLNLVGTPFRELIQPCYLGPLGEEDVNERGTSRCSLDVELAVHGGCRAKIHAGVGLVRKPGLENSQEVRFILDNDLFMLGNVPINLSAAALNTLHQEADSLFLGAITERLREAMEPVELL